MRNSKETRSKLFTTDCVTAKYSSRFDASRRYVATHTIIGELVGGSSTGDIIKRPA